MDITLYYFLATAEHGYEPFMYRTHDEAVAAAHDLSRKLAYRNIAIEVRQLYGGDYDTVATVSTTMKG